MKCEACGQLEGSKHLPDCRIFTTDAAAWSAGLAGLTEGELAKRAREVIMVGDARANLEQRVEALLESLHANAREYTRLHRAGATDLADDAERQAEARVIAALVGQGERELAPPEHTDTLCGTCVAKVTPPERGKPCQWCGVEGDGDPQDTRSDSAPQGVVQEWSLTDEEVGYIAGALMFRVEELERVRVLGFYGGCVELRDRFITAVEGPASTEDFRRIGARTT